MPLPWPVEDLKRQLSASPAGDVSKVRLENRNFDRQDLSSLSDFSRLGSAEGCSFVETDLSRCSFEGTEFKNCRFDGANLRESVWRNIYLDGCSFNGTDLTGADFRILFDTSAEKLAGGRNWHLARWSATMLEKLGLKPAHSRRLDSNSIVERRTFNGYSFVGRDLKRFSFRELELKKAIFEDADLADADFTNADLTGATFGEANLKDAKLDGANITEADFSGAQSLTTPQVHTARAWLLARWGSLTEQLELSADHDSLIEKRNLSGKDFSSQPLRDVTFENWTLDGASFRDVKADELRFNECSLRGAQFQGFSGKAFFSGCDLEGCDVTGADFRGSTFSESNPSACHNWHLALWLQDDAGRITGNGEHSKRAPHRDFRKYNFREKSLNGFDFSSADLRGADFTGADLTDAELTDAKLDEAILTEAILIGTKVTDQQLRQAKNWFRAKYGGGRFKLPPGHDEKVSSLDFCGRDLAGMDLRNNDFANAYFSDANLTGCNLSEVNLDGADLNGAKLRNAVFRGTDLSKTKNLTAHQLLGCDLRQATLPPEIGEFASVDIIEAAAPMCKNLFLVVLGACLYSLLTIATTKDAALFGGSSTLALPIVQTAIPVAGFYLAAPLLLLAVYAYFVFNVHNLWISFSSLPAFFSDGRTVLERTFPWLMHQKVLAHMPNLSGHYTSVAKLQHWLAHTLAYWSVPFTLLIFWWRYLVRRDQLMTGLHLALLCTSIFIALQFARFAKDTLSGVPPRVRRTNQQSSGSSKRSLVLALPVALLLAAISWILFAGSTLRADLDEEELTPKPAGWKGASQSDLGGVKRRTLQGVQLPFASLRESFLVRMQFVRSHMPKTDFTEADLREAVFVSVTLTDANFTGADLRGATLGGCSLSGGEFGDANLEGATIYNCPGLEAREVGFAHNWPLAFADAELRKALGLPVDHNARLQFRDFRSYRLRNVDLVKADLHDWNFEKAELTTLDFEGSNLDWAVFQGAVLRNVNFKGATLQNADLRGVDLSKCEGLTTVQLRSARIDDKTILPSYIDVSQLKAP